jgi:hypothetical protein
MMKVVVVSSTRAVARPDGRWRMTDYLKIIHGGKNPYEGFDHTKYELDLQGWCNPDFFKKMIKQVRPKTIIEVGSWKGKSAIAMAEALKSERLNDSKIICVDTFLGATEFIAKEDEDPKRGLRRINGYPTIYYQFLANVVKSGHQDMIIPFPQTSTNAARFFGGWGMIQFDLAFIDGSHEYEDVSSDLYNYYPLLSKDGIMCGDDYCEYWNGVREAVNEFKENETGCDLALESYDNGPGQAQSDYWILTPDSHQLVFPGI